MKYAAPSACVRAIFGFGVGVGARGLGFVLGLGSGLGLGYGMGWDCMVWYGMEVEMEGSTKFRVGIEVMVALG